MTVPVGELTSVELLNEKESIRFNAYMKQWQELRFNNVVKALEANNAEDYLTSARLLDEISLGDFIKDIDNAYGNQPHDLCLKEAIRKSMLESLRSINMDRQSFNDFYDDVQMKAAVKNIKLAIKKDDKSEREWRLDQANKNLHVMFGQKARYRAGQMKKRIHSFKRNAEISLFAEARQRFPRL